uniref:Uncharacterized protein n=1 Tax=Cucumis melo TaxID=3656 RepID=A0A9I9DDF3_CUCME
MLMKFSVIVFSSGIRLEDDAVVPSSRRDWADLISQRERGRSGKDERIKLTETIHYRFQDEFTYPITECMASTCERVGCGDKLERNAAPKWSELVEKSRGNGLDQGADCQ